MSELSKLQYLVEDRAADKKIEKIRAEQNKTAELIENLEREIAQGENKIKRLSGSMSAEQRKARTRRLIERGAILEEFIPNAPALTNEAVKAALSLAFRDEVA